MTIKRPSLSDLARFLHPWLMFTYPVLQLYGHNITELTTSVLNRPLLFLLSLNTAVWLILLLIPFTRRQSALLLSTSWFFLFTHGHLTTAIFPNDTPIFAEIIYLGLYLLAVTFLLRSRAVLQPLHTILTGMLLLLTFFPLAKTISYLIEDPVIEGASGQEESFPPELKAVLSEPVENIERPDIYFLVVDRYSSARSLRQYLHFSNTEFEDKLRSKGFYIAEESMANYPATFLSVASSLNARYLDDLRQYKNTSNKTYAYGLIRNAMVPRFLKQLGYRYIHVGNWFDATQTSRVADQVYRYDVLPILPSLELNEFELKLIQTTWAALPIRFLLAHQNKSSKMDRYSLAVTKAQNQITFLKHTPFERGPKFIFCHLLLTHPPYYFAADGSINSFSRSQKTNDPRIYLDSLQAANRQLLDIIETIDRHSSKPPVIIVQADEGPYSSLLRPDREWQHEKTRLRFRCEILSALRIPGIDQTHLKPALSPVNNFRLIFNTFFKTRLPILPDEVYFSPSLHDLYRFTKATRDMRNNALYFESHPMVDDWSAH